MNGVAFQHKQAPGLDAGGAWQRVWQTSSSCALLPSLSHIRKRLLKMYFIDYPWPVKLAPRRSTSPAKPSPAGVPACLFSQEESGGTPGYEK